MGVHAISTVSLREFSLPRPPRLQRYSPPPPPPPRPKQQFCDVYHDSLSTLRRRSPLRVFPLRSSTVSLVSFASSGGIKPGMDADCTGRRGQNGMRCKQQRKERRTKGKSLKPFLGMPKVQRDGVLFMCHNKQQKKVTIACRSSKPRYHFRHRLKRSLNRLNRAPQARKHVSRKQQQAEGRLPSASKRSHL